MAIQRYQLSVIKSPMGSGYIGMLTGSHFDGDPLTLYTMDEFGSMQEYETPAEADKAIKMVLFALGSMKFKPSSEITAKELGKNVRIISSDEELFDDL